MTMNRRTQLPTAVGTPSYLLGRVPGVELEQRNTLNAFGSEEVDVAFFNGKSRNGLHFLPHLILVECKNWSTPVGSQEVAYFASVLQHRCCEYGILVAASGITGDPQELTKAHFEIAQAQVQGYRILVLTREELEHLASTDELVRLLKQKLCQMVVSGTQFLPTPRA
jgi:restriction endonuclease